MDIVLSGTRRALVGNLGSEGWLRIPRLMIHHPRPYIRFVGVSGGSTNDITDRFASAFQCWGQIDAGREPVVCCRNSGAGSIMGQFLASPGS